MATERIEAYFENSKQLILAKNWQKALPELRKLATYLLKHQNETVPDGAKGKLLQTIEGYYRFYLQSESNSVAQALDAVVALLGTYLQLPEGKLLSATIKKKVLVWYQGLSATPQESSQSAKLVSTNSTWLVQTINEKGALTLLSASDDQLWKEDFSPSNPQEFAEQISALLAEDFDVLMELNESNNAIISISAQS
jgi:hypothetical protein